jgi:AcrR family transcriptional regulator
VNGLSGDSEPPNVLLSRDRIVTAAITLLDRDGEEGFTIRRLADELGIHVPVIYAFVDSKRTIVDGVLERTLADLPNRSNRTAPWQDEVRLLTRALRDHLVAHPWLTRLSQQAVPPSLHKFGESLQALFAGAGLDRHHARLYRRLIVWTVWGFAAVEPGGSVARSRARAEGGDDPVDVDELFSAAVDAIVLSVEVHAGGPSAIARAEDALGRQ